MPKGTSSLDAEPAALYQGWQALLDYVGYAIVTGSFERIAETTDSHGNKCFHLLLAAIGKQKLKLMQLR